MTSPSCFGESQLLFNKLVMDVDVLAARSPRQMWRRAEATAWLEGDVPVRIHDQAPIKDDDSVP